MKTCFGGTFDPFSGKGGVLFQKKIITFFTPNYMLNIPKRQTLFLKLHQITCWIFPKGKHCFSSFYNLFYTKLHAEYSQKANIVSQVCNFWINILIRDTFRIVLIHLLKFFVEYCQNTKRLCFYNPWYHLHYITLFPQFVHAHYFSGAC